MTTRKAVSNMLQSNPLALVVALVGAVFVLVGLAILFRLHHVAEAWLLQTLPPWLIDLSVSL